MPNFSPESFVSPPLLPRSVPAPREGLFGPLADHFGEFRSLVACLALALPDGPQADTARQVSAGLDMWACFVDDAREAAGRAPETDLLLTATWGARLSDIVRDARHALCLDELFAGAGAAAVSIGRHDTAISLSRFPEPAAQPVAGPARRRAPRARRRRR